MALALFTVLVNVLVYQGRTEDQVVGKRVSGDSHSHSNSIITPDQTEGEKDIRTPNEEQGNPDSQQQHQVQQEEEAVRGSSSKFKAILKSPVSYFLAFYIFLYVSLNLIFSFSEDVDLRANHTIDGSGSHCRWLGDHFLNYRKRRWCGLRLCNFWFLRWIDCWKNHSYSCYEVVGT